jgi:Cu2+-exporting ATPase
MSVVVTSSALDAPSDPFLKSSGETTELCLIVADMHCAGCMGKIEKGLGSMPGVTYARTNLSTRRVVVRWQGKAFTSEDIVGALEGIGFGAVPFNPGLVASADETMRKRLLRSMAVAGFAAANVMLLSVSVWSGASGDMEPATRDLFHWLSALIALPTIAYSGQPFFVSALRALKVRSLNMDVPISLAVLLAAAMSLFETVRGGEEVYFDASVTLLFFLLIGRYLDLSMRARACSAAQNLLGLRASAAMKIEPDGERVQVPVEALRLGMRVAVAAGTRVPVDGIVSAGASDVDMSLVTGESLPLSARVGTEVFAGTLNMSGPLEIDVTKEDDDTLLAEIVRLMEAAEQGRAGFVQLADRVAQFYAPAVHILAVAAFALWMVLGAGWHEALMIAIAVLIVTCPCALALAVPVVQVVASGHLMRLGVLVKSADGLERLADVTHVVFDKTGTLTLGEPHLVAGRVSPEKYLIAGASLARDSRHPLAKALVREARGCDLRAATQVSEIAGSGMEGIVEGRRVRLGRAGYVNPATDEQGAEEGARIWVSIEGEGAHCFRFQDELRPDGALVTGALTKKGLGLTLLSGDVETEAARIAEVLHIEDVRADQRPADKIKVLEELATGGKKTLMVGDGLNDAPALKAASVSMSPSSASDVAQVAADFIFQGKSLAPVLEAIEVARMSRRLVLQNFGLAALYNSIAIPLAFAGLITPLIAAIAMSSSSILVTLNALRLSAKGGT